MFLVRVQCWVRVDLTSSAVGFELSAYEYFCDMRKKASLRLSEHSNPAEGEKASPL